MNANFNETNAIRASQQGDLEAFNQIIAHYQDFLFRVALRVTGDEDMACDAVQEACVLLFKNINSFRGDSLRGWLARIVSNVCLDELRRQGRQRTRPLETSNEQGEDLTSAYWMADFSSNPEREYQNHELHAVIQSHLEQLPPVHRMILTLIDMEELSYEEAAAALGVPMGTVKSRLARARTELRKKLLASNYLAGMSISGYTICSPRDLACLAVEG